MRANNTGRFETCPYGWISQQLRIMHNGFPNGWIFPTITNYAQWISQWMDLPNNYELCIMHNGFSNGLSPQQLRIMHYARWISQWMDYPNNYELCIMNYELYCGRI